MYTCNRLIRREVNFELQYFVEEERTPAHK